MLSFPQELKHTESEVKKIRKAMDLEKKAREMEAAKEKQMQMAFKQTSTKILSQVLQSTIKSTNCPSFSTHRMFTNLITKLCTQHKIPSAQIFHLRSQCLIELSGLAAKPYTATCFSGSDGSKYCGSSCACIE